MLDKSFIGHTFPPYEADVEKGRLKFFAKVIGETNPIYTDEAAAREQGHRAERDARQYLHDHHRRRDDDDDQRPALAGLRDVLDERVVVRPAAGR